MRLSNQKNVSHRTFTYLLIFFGLIYSIISLVNHYYFRSYALDLGLYTNALYDYIHFTWNDSLVYKPEPENLLSDHFDLYLVILSPLSLIFKTYTLLIVQITSILLGGLGVYKLFLLRNKKTAFYASLYFFLFFGVFGAIAKDYHSNVLTAMIVPWLFYYVFLGRKLFSSILFMLCLIGKENMSLWLFFICSGLLFSKQTPSSIKKLLIGFCIFSILYFLSMVSWVMPALSNNNHIPHFDFAHIGKTPKTFFLYVITHPFETFKMLFVNHSEQELGNFVKTEAWIFLFLNGLWVLCRKPLYLWMLIPLVAQKFLHDSVYLWGITGHYNIEFGVIFCLGIYDICSNNKGRKINKHLMIGFCIIAGLSTMRMMDASIAYHDKAAIRFYQKAHYTQKFNVKKAHDLLKKIPKNAKVSATTSFLPHLALRDHIYGFPIIKDAEYVVYSETGSFYPLTSQQGLAKVLKLKQNGYGVWAGGNGVWILKKD